MQPHTGPILPIEDYAMIGDLQTASLVGRNGSIDWLCLPRFDAAACFAALLGDAGNGRWSIAPTGHVDEIQRRYRSGTLVLETEFRSVQGSVAVIDFMPPADQCERCDVIRLVEGRAGKVSMRTEMAFRFEYGRVVPWVQRAEDGISAIAGPDALRVRTPVGLCGEDFRTVGQFAVAAGETVPFVLTWHRSYRPTPCPLDPLAELRRTEQWWRTWCAQCRYAGPWRSAVLRSLITLKGLTYAPTGGIVAAPTTSLPEALGAARNWDYRYCWIRDASLTLNALISAGFLDEARTWREWLLRTVAGSPEQLQVVYGVAGERRLAEIELPWLKGYAASRPVRIGNGAETQLQLDVLGELMDAFHTARMHGIEPVDHAWAVQRALLAFLETIWTAPDNGIWEVRGPRRHFTYSKVMAWVAFDRAIAAVDRFGLDGPVERWRALRERIHADVCQHGFDPRRNAFVQFYGGSTLDAALLLMPQTGFLPADDPRVVGTVEAIHRDLTCDGLVRRYEAAGGVDGLAGSEGAFLACSFWMAQVLAMMGRRGEAETMFERLLGLANDVGLLSEQYDPGARRLLGNFPQAFSHIALVNAAVALGATATPRAREGMA